MTDSHAEQLDPTVLGEEVGDHGRPGDDIVPEEPFAVEDPSIIAHGVIARDDVESRDDRLEPDTDEVARNSATGDDSRVGGLFDPGTSSGAEPQIDDEEQLVAEEAVQEESGAEAQAMHREPER